MKQLIVLAVLLCTISVSFAQDSTRHRITPRKGALNTEVFGGYGMSIPVGGDAVNMRNAIKDAEDASDDYKGTLAPKSSAYVGVTVDYQFHKVAAIGFGLVYTARGFWLWEKNAPSPHPPVTIADSRKTFVSIDYFDIPIYYKEYLAHDRFILRFGPVISLPVVTKVRIVTKEDNDKTKTTYRLGEEHVDGATFNEMPRPVVPGFEADFSYGSANGLHGTLGLCYSTTLFQNVDIRSFLIRLGVGYTFSN